jgi:hypothetical protein
MFSFDFQYPHRGMILKTETTYWAVMAFSPPPMGAGSPCALLA